MCIQRINKKTWEWEEEFIEKLNQSGKHKDGKSLSK